MEGRKMSEAMQKQFDMVTDKMRADWEGRGHKFLDFAQYCPKCGNGQPSKNFYKNKDGTYSRYCKACSKDYQRGKVMCPKCDHKFIPPAT